ncbi:unnamed protein product [Tenebrio molitor]|nr:unnamed protein product [Tenebrio molitor]
MERRKSDGWKIFIKELYKLLSGYEFQRDVTKYNVKNLEDWGKTDKPQGIVIHNNMQQFFTILQNYNIDTFHINKSEIYENVDKIRELNRVLKFTLKHEPQRSFSTEDTKLVVKGAFVKFGSIPPESYTEVNTVEIFATDTVFIDSDFVASRPGFSLVIMAPKWWIVGARSIKIGSEDGQKNNSTSNFLVIAESITNEKDITITYDGDSDVICCLPEQKILENSRELSQENRRRYRDSIVEFKVFLREYWRKNKYRKEDIKAFLTKLDTSEDVLNYLGLEGLIHDYQRLENQSRYYKNSHVELFPFYENLLEVAVKRAQSFTSSSEDDKIVTFHLYTTLLTKLNLAKENTVDTSLPVKIENFLHSLSEKFVELKRKNGYSIFDRYQEIDKDGVDTIITNSLQFISKYTSDEFKNDTTRDLETSDVTRSILKMVSVTLEDLGTVGLKVNEILATTNQVSKFLYLGKSPKIVAPSDEISAIRTTTESLQQKLPGADQFEDGAKTKPKECGREIENAIVALLKIIKESVDRFESELTAKFLSSLDVTKWEVPKVLKRVKYYVKQLPKEKSSNTLEGLNLMIDSYRRVESYYRQKTISDYVRLQEQTDWVLKLKNEGLSRSVRQMRNATASNLIISEYENDINFVKQYAFPYVDEVFKQLKLSHKTLRQSNDLTVLAGACSDSISSLGHTLFHSVSRIDEYIMLTKTYDYRNPLYTWSHKTHKSLFRKLFAGEEILLKADVKSNSHNGVHFNGIEIDFRAVDKKQQSVISAAFNYFKIRLTHTGNSYYRCDDKVYLITTAPSVMEYSHMKSNSSKLKRVSQNGVYIKIEEGDPVLSPYTTWRLQLLAPRFNVNPIFDKLTNFEDMVDLRLVGSGKYLTDDAFVCNRNVDGFYELEDPQPEPYSGANRYRRAASFVPYTSASSGLSSPLNNIFKWISSTLTPSIRRIYHLGAFASKSSERVPEQSLNPLIFFDQVNSVLILAPVVLCLGKSYFDRHSASGKKKKDEIEASRVDTWTNFACNFKAILLKYNLKKTWLWFNLEDRSEEISSVRTWNEAEALENRLVTLLVDFLDDIRYDSTFVAVKYNHKFIADVDALINVATKISNFTNKIQTL